MKIQSLSIAVPVGEGKKAGCLNDCAFCVSHMHHEDYPNRIEKSKSLGHHYVESYKQRMMYARDNGCNTLMFTSNGESLLNRGFFEKVAYWNKSLPSPFKCIELQTSGTLLDDDYLMFLRDTVGVSTISLSLSDVFSSEKNAEYNRTKKGFEIDIDSLCKKIKEHDFNLRLSLNMTDSYNTIPAKRIISRVKELGADQVTFRILYEDSKNPNCDQNLWIREHGCLSERIEAIKYYIKTYGNALEVLPFGAIKYSLDGLSVVVDSDCMAQDIKDAVKYLVLRPNCRLYSKWDDKGSLIF